MTLTVKELIEDLKKYPDDYLVYAKGHFKGNADVGNLFLCNDDDKRIHLDIGKPDANI